MRQILLYLLSAVLVVSIVGCESGRLASRQSPTTDDPATEVPDVQVATTADDPLAEDLAATTTTLYAPPTDGTVVVTEGIDYRLNASELPSNPLNELDIYAPPQATNAPVMVMIHGGGWQIGDKANRGLLENKVPFFTEKGWLLVSINYRLSPAVQHPAHVQDVASAITWVHQHIANYGGDPAQVYLMGHSAGAHLAALVATDAEYLAAEGLALDALSGVILLDGAGYDVATQAEFARGQAQTMYHNAFGDDPAVWESASPISHVAADQGIPPFFITYVVRREPSRVQSERLATALTEAGVPATLFPAVGKSHASINQEFGLAGDAVTDAAWAWLQEQPQ
jgi:arylformamidase